MINSVLRDLHEHKTVFRDPSHEGRNLSLYLAARLTRLESKSKYDASISQSCKLHIPLMAFLECASISPETSQVHLVVKPQTRLPVIECAGVATHFGWCWSRIEPIAVAAKTKVVTTSNNLPLQSCGLALPIIRNKWSLFEVMMPSPCFLMCYD